MTTRSLAQHHRIRILLLLLLLLAVIGLRAIEGQATGPLTSAEVRRAADTSTRLHVVISLAARRLWVIGAGGDTQRTAPVAVGSGRRLSFNGRIWRFATPIGIRTVVSAEEDPVWIRPDWAYVELARQKKVRLDSVSVRGPRVLPNGDSLVVRGSDIGVAKGGTFTVWPSDRDIVIRGVLYVPPLGSPYRFQAGALGKYRLNLGNSVGLHGTLDKQSIGKAVTHGCLRLGDEDIEWLHLNVPVGTLVFIY